MWNGVIRQTAAFVSQNIICGTEEAYMFYRTTNNLTTHIAEAVSGLLGLNNMEQPIEYIVRAVSVPSKRCGILLSLPVSRNTNRIIINQKAFFGLNLAFNGVVSRPSSTRCLIVVY